MEDLLATRLHMTASLGWYIIFACIGLAMPFFMTLGEGQPAKLTAPLLIGGIPDDEDQEVHFAMENPGALSLLAHGNFQEEVTGLDRIPEAERPPMAITHFAFQIMSLHKKNRS